MKKSVSKNLPIPVLIVLIILLAITALFLVKQRNKQPSLADLYYGGKCFRVLAGNAGKIGKNEGTVIFSGTVDNVCDRTATIQRIRIYTYTDDKYKNLYDDIRTFVPNDSPQTIQPGGKISFSYTLKIYGDELHGFHFYKLVAEE